MNSETKMQLSVVSNERGRNEMGETKWTQGPWRMVGKAIYALNDDGTNRFYASVQDSELTLPEELAANARLMAASPAMYRRLAACAQNLRAIGMMEEAAMCDEVLSQARGEN